MYLIVAAAAAAAFALCATPRMHFLLVRNEDEVFGQLATLLAALLDALSSDSERVVLQVGGFVELKPSGCC